MDGPERILGWTEEEACKNLYSFFETNFFKTLSLVPNAKEGLQQLAEHHTLYIISARPFQTYRQTQYWIEENIPGLISGLCLTNQWPRKNNATTKPMVCKQLGVLVMVEDNLTQAQDCASKGIDVLLLDYPWNQTANLDRQIKRVYSWDEITDEIFKYKK